MEPDEASSETKACEDALQRHGDALLQKANVVGVGVGRKVVGGEEQDELCVTVFVREKVPLSALRKRDRIPERVDNVPTDVIETGEIVAYARTERLRPCPPGMSIGHVDVTAGTFGCVVQDAIGRRLILSNNHVLAAANDATPGDALLQPGRIDGGTLDDVIGRLLRFVPIDFDGSPSSCPFASAIVGLLNAISRFWGRRSRFVTTISPERANWVDAAVGLPDREGDVEAEILEVGTPVGTEPAAVGLEVTKSGRTTGTTQGRVTQIAATIRVSYGAGRSATFTDQVVIADGQFSAPGDSGSAICTLGTAPRLVGLLFAGGSSITVANRIDRVFDLLEVRLPGETSENETPAAPHNVK